MEPHETSRDFSVVVWENGDLVSTNSVRTGEDIEIRVNFRLSEIHRQPLRRRLKNAVRAFFAELHGYEYQIIAKKRSGWDLWLRWKYRGHITKDGWLRTKMEV